MPCFTDCILLTGNSNDPSQAITAAGGFYSRWLRPPFESAVGSLLGYRAVGSLVLVCSQPADGLRGSNNIIGG
jgi:hypothetical protein